MTESKKIDSRTPASPCKPYIKKMLTDSEINNSENANIICDYIMAEQIEINIKDRIKYDKIQVFMYLSRFSDDKKSYTEMTSHDILNY